jgi:PAS domain S-box-containing protein
MELRALGLESQAQLIELAYAAMIVRDPDSRIVYWNPRAEEVYGWTEDEALGQVTHMLLRTQFPISCAAVEVALGETGRWVGELTHIRRDGQPIIVVSRQALQRDANGNPAFILEVNLDVTEQRRAETEVRRLNAELEDRVAQRTTQLATALAERDREIAQRKQDQAALQAAYKQLSEQAEELKAQSEELRTQNEAINKSTHALAISEARYRESATRFRTVAEFTWDWEFWLDADRRFAYISPSCERVSGYTSQTFTDRPALFTEIIHPEDRPSVLAALDRALAGQSEAGLDYRLRRKDGKWAWVSFVFQPVTDTQGQFLGVRGSVRDVTRRREAEAEAERRAAETNAIFAALVDPVIVFGPEGHVVRFNAAAITANGFDPSMDRGDGRPFDEIVAHIALRYPDGTEIPQLALPSKRALRGETLKGGRLLLGNNHGEWRSILVSAAPIPDTSTRADAAPVGAVLSWHDITERENLLAQLDAERAILRTVFERAPVALVATDAQCRITITNPLADQMHPVPYEPDRVAQAAFQICYSDGRPCDPHDLPLTRSAMEGETFTDVEMLILDPDGASRDLLVNTAPIRDAAGAITGAVGAFLDITARKTIQREREQLLAQTQSQAAELLTQNDELAQLSRELTESRGRLQAVIEQMPAGVVIAEAPSGKIILFNQQIEELMRGAYRAVSSPQNYLQFASYRPDGSVYEPTEIPLARTILTGEVVIEEEMHVTRGDNSTGVMLVSSRPVYDDAGCMMAGVVTFYDITERQALEASLRQARDELERRVQERTAELILANARLEQHSNQLQLLHEVDRAILAAESAEEIAQAALRQLRKALPVCRADVVTYDFPAQRVTWLAADTAQKTQLGAGRNAPLAACRIPPGHSEGEAREIADLGELDNRTEVEEILFGEGLRRSLSLPLLLGGQLIGSLNLWGDTRGTFAPDEIRLAMQVANSLSIAIQNARLFEQVHTSRQELQALSRRLVELQENERRAIARELHDESGQSLTALMLGLGMLERECTEIPTVAARLHELKETTNGIMEELHQLAMNLRPASLDRAGLAPALRQYIQTYEQQHGIAAQLVVVGLDGPRLPPNVETALYRVTQEALTNVLRHARAANVGVIIERHHGRVTCIIEDDGVGFDVEAAQANGRVGLLGMRERAEMLGGRLNIESTPGAGATIFVEIPV